MSTHHKSRIERLLGLLKGHPIVIVGMMGAGKTTVGRRLAALLGWEFIDSDTEIETAAGMSIEDFFAAHGEEEFRSGESRVIARLLRDQNKVIATGGGAYMSEATRKMVSELACSVWIKADLDLLFDRVSRRANRPLLKTKNPRQTLQNLIDQRYPIYAHADTIVISKDVPQEMVADEIVVALIAHLEAKPSGQSKAEQSDASQEYPNNAKQKT